MNKLIKLLSLLIFLILCFPLFSQEKGQIIQLTANLETKGSPEATITGVNVTTNNADYIEPYKYRIIGITDSTVKLLALNFNVPTTEDREESPSTKWLADVYNNKVYTISRNDFNQYHQPVEKIDRIKLGILALPYKARSVEGSLSFDTEFSLNTTLNINLYQFKNTTSLNLLLGSGIGNIGLNSSNATGLDADEAIDAATLTFLAGPMVEYNRIQMGLYFGYDYINNQRVFQWNGNGKLWFGIGIGYNIFTISKENNTKQS